MCSGRSPKALRLHYRVHGKVINRLLQPKCLLIIAGLISTVIYISQYNRKTIFDYFKHQSDRALVALQDSTCQDTKLESNVYALSNRVDLGSSSPLEHVEELVNLVVDRVNLTRNYTIDIMRNAMRCPTVDIANIYEVIKSDESHSYRMQLPVTALPLTAKVEYSQRWKNLRLPIIAIHVRGRLGNVMGEYASMFAIQKVYGIQVVQTPECNKELEQAFHHLSIPVLELDDWDNWVGLPVDERSYPKYEVLELAALGLLGPHRFVSYDYPFETQLFNAFRQEIKEEFTFTDQVYQRSYEFLSSVNTSGFASPPTFIAVHGRFTDYFNHMEKLYGLKYSNYDRFFRSAISFCEERFVNPVYIVASDDVPHMESMFARFGVKDVYYSRGSPVEDMGLLSRCNHSIMTFGSFGFWTAYLGSGITLYPDVKTPIPCRFSRPMYEESFLTDFIPLPFDD